MAGWQGMELKRSSCRCESRGGYGAAINGARVRGICKHAVAMAVAAGDWQPGGVVLNFMAAAAGYL